MNHVAPTSIHSYHSLVRTGTRLEQAELILGVYRSGGNWTDREVEARTGIRSNTVSARRNELVSDGEVEWAGDRKCRVTGRTVQSWRFKEEAKTLTMF